MRPLRRERYSLRGVLVAVLALIAVVTLSATSSFAATIHKFTTSITQTEPLTPFGEPWGLALDSNGSLYVADASLNPAAVETPGAVDIFSPLNVFQPPQIDDKGAFTGPYVRSVAVDNLPGPNQGMVYVAESNAETVDVFKAEGAGKYKLLQVPPRKFGYFMYVAFDNSGGPNSGSLYVIAEHGAFLVKPEADGKLPLSGEVALKAPAEGFSLSSTCCHGGIGGLAVGPTGKVYLANPLHKAVDVYDEKGENPVVFSEGPPGGGAFEPISVGADPSNGDVYVVDASNHVIDQFSSEGKYLSRISIGQSEEHLASPLGVAVNTAGDVYVSDAATKAVDVFGPGVIVPDVTTGSVSNLTATSATLTGTVNPDGEGTASCQFVWGTTTALVNTAPCPAAIAEGNAAVPVEVTLSEGSSSKLEPNTIYHYRLQATNKNGTNVGESSQNREFTTPGPPSVDDEAVSNVTSTSATLEAAINPHKTPTTFYFQYGTTTGYGASAPAPPGTAIGSGPEDVRVTPQQVQGLLAGTVYHYRAVAIGEPTPGHFEEVPGPDRSFTTQPAGGPGQVVLSDGRQWELVSPSNKHGANLLAIGSASSIQASASGDAIAYLASAPTESQPEGNADAHVQVLSRRVGMGASAWASQDIATPHTSTVGVPGGPGEGEYRIFSTDLSVAVVQPLGKDFEPALSPEASERTAYLRTDWVSGHPGEPCLHSCYRPLVTGAPGFANVPEGTAFGREGICNHACGPYFRGATPDLSHIVLTPDESATGQAALIEGAPPGSLYEWAGGHLQLLSIDPKGQPATAEPTLGFVDVPTHRDIATNAISADGSRVVWSERGGALHLYLRDVSREHTVQLDAGLTGTPEYQTADTAGSRVFFTENGDLYQCVITEAEERLKCTLSDLTPAGGVQGILPGASGDGQSVYFVANGVLTGTPNARGESAVPGDCGTAAPENAQTCNLYLRRAGDTKLIAVLSGADSPDWGRRTPAGVDTGPTTRVAPHGRYLAFMSQRSLTGFDNRDVVNGKPDEEVYLYDSEPRPGAQPLLCASCNPTGARPHGVEYGQIDTSHGGLAGGQSVWPETTWLAANLPGWSPINQVGFERYQSRYLSDGGRLFFNSSDALVPQDTNRTEDVYQYEPPGIGDCSTESPTFGARSDGCVSLISSGTSKEESAFLDASESGGDVFFLTTAQLSHRDTDNARDVYDARIGGGESEPQAPPSCEGDACQSPAGAPSDPTPGSLTYQGSGNLIPEPGAPSNPKTAAQIRAEKLTKALKACRKHRSKRTRAKCEKQAHKRFGPAKRANRSSKKRRAGR